MINNDSFLKHHHRSRSLLNYPRALPSSYKWHLWQLVPRRTLTPVCFCFLFVTECSYCALVRTTSCASSPWLSWCHMTIGSHPHVYHTRVGQWVTPGKGEKWKMLSIPEVFVRWKLHGQIIFSVCIRVGHLDRLTLAYHLIFPGTEQWGEGPGTCFQSTKPRLWYSHPP